MPYLSYFISLINQLLNMFGLYFGVDVDEEEPAVEEPAE